MEISCELKSVFYDQIAAAKVIHNVALSLTLNQKYTDI